MAKQADMLLGVDVGGTKILALLVTAQGQVLARSKVTVAAGQPLLEQIAEAVDGVLEEALVPLAEVAGMGLALPGVVDSQANRLVHAPNLEVDDPEVAQRLSERYGIPVLLGNDVNLGTLAEVWLGAGRGAQSVVGVFVGTGIGGGVVLGGKLLEGCEDQAGEIGHLVLKVDGQRCGCGNRGCFEALASRTALERDLRAALGRGRESTILNYTKGDRLRSAAWASALAAGDELVTELLRREAHYLAQGILSIRHMVDPEVVVLGGGVMEGVGRYLLPLIEAEVRQDPLRRSREKLRLVLSALGDDAVALGAAALMHERLGGEPPSCGPPERLPVRYPALQGLQFGEVEIKGERLANDLYVRADGKVKKRNKRHAREAWATSHVLDAEELRKACKGAPRVLIIGTGFSGMVRLAEDAGPWLEQAGIEYHLLPTPEAVAAWEALEGPKALWLHVTC